MAVCGIFIVHIFCLLNVPQSAIDKGVGPSGHKKSWKAFKNFPTTSFISVLCLSVLCGSHATWFITATIASETSFKHTLTITAKTLCIVVVSKAAKALEPCYCRCHLFQHCLFLYCCHKSFAKLSDLRRIQSDFLHFNFCGAKLVPCCAVFLRNSPFICCKTTVFFILNNS